MHQMVKGLSYYTRYRHLLLHDIKSYADNTYEKPKHFSMDSHPQR